ncbi:DUF3370 domain-containing protein [Altericista sp. CCNU0014]|uniref:DUF3370 domain-containing protein n=1 Tax=Altericista sp. CCNU0014 TaxID=3082949 RepID=UPI00384E1DBF
MFSLLSSVLIAQAAPTVAPKPDTIVKPQIVRVLPGRLDDVLVFNSNSPEVVQTEGILLSTFPKEGKAHPEAHLDRVFQGRFDIFAHHISNQAKTSDPLKTLYLGILLHNPSTKPVTVNVLQAASYLSQPDAPFIDLPPLSDNALGNIFAGPGDRATNDILRQQRQPNWPATLVVPPGTSEMLLNVPIPVKALTPPINGRSTLAYLRSNGPVYAASLAMYAKSDSAGQERAPTRDEWETLLKTGTLSGPRDKAPTLPEAKGKIIYGRVAGVARGSRWLAQLTDPGNPSTRLTVPNPGEAFSYLLSGLAQGTFGTGQVQSAPMVVRYPDTAYAAHGNYGVHYSLTLPLYNSTESPKKVALMLQTPLKADAKPTELTFFNPPPKRVFFRGTVRVRYKDDSGNPQTRYIHLVQSRGQQGEPLVELNLDAQTSRLVQVDFIYPPDATPPQVLTVKTKS